MHDETHETWVRENNAATARPQGNVKISKERVFVEVVRTIREEAPSRNQKYLADARWKRIVWITKKANEKFMRPAIVSFAAALVLAVGASAVQAATVFGFPYKGALRIQVPDSPSATAPRYSIKNHAEKPKQRNGRAKNNQHR